MPTQNVPTSDGAGSDDMNRPNSAPASTNKTSSTHGRYGGGLIERRPVAPVASLVRRSRQGDEDSASRRQVVARKAARRLGRELRPNPAGRDVERVAARAELVESFGLGRLYEIGHEFRGPTR